MSTKTNFLLSEGEFYHIYNRGVNREPIFLEQRNYIYFLQRMKEYYDPASLELIAYCLMPNHFHLIIRQLTPFGATKFFKSVCDGYVKAVNKAYGKTGHLFEGKYKMKKIDSDEYLLHLSRYIHLNPVRAGLVVLPEEWVFSSCGSYFGKESDIGFKSEYVLRQFNSNENYKDFVREYKSEDKMRIEKLLF